MVRDFEICISNIYIYSHIYIYILFVHALISKYALSIYLLCVYTFVIRVSKVSQISKSTKNQHVSQIWSGCLGSVEWLPPPQLHMQ